MPDYWERRRVEAIADRDDRRLRRRYEVERLAADGHLDQLTPDELVELAEALERRAGTMAAHWRPAHGSGSLRDRAVIEAKLRLVDQELRRRGEDAPL
jgi:hypothetical protein